MNRGLENTMNSNIPCIDIDYFQESIQDLIVKYFTYNPVLDSQKKYLLYQICGEKYIIWIKYKKLNEISHKEGFEVRSFYKCEKEIDILKYQGTKEVEFDKDCYCCIDN
jgi:hypothetical protein